MGQSDAGQDFVIRRRRLSFLGHILQSWQRAVISQATFFLPELLNVQNATRTNSPNIYHYEQHHGLLWRSSEFISARPDCKTLVVHLANDGFLCISDKDMESDPLGKPNDHHPNEPDGWAELKTSRCEAAWKELEDFTLFADKWFGSSLKYRKMVLYNSALRRIDICFQSETLNAKDHGRGYHRTGV
jgi:hypothetical protein